MAEICRQAARVDIAPTLDVQTDEQLQSDLQKTCEGEEGIGCVKWMGPSPLTLPAGGECRPVCHVELKKPVDKEVLMVDASPSQP